MSCLKSRFLACFFTVKYCEVIKSEALTFAGRNATDAARVGK